MTNDNDTFIWTEGINCMPILQNALKSLDKHHKNLEINIFIDQKSQISFFPINNTFNFIRINDTQKKKFNSGHFGTASLWSSIIKNNNSKYFIHFDSDVIFFNNIINTLLLEIQNGYDLIGPIRNYKNNPYNLSIYKSLPDTVSTYLFAFNKDKINPNFFKNNFKNFFKIFSFKNLNIKNDVKNFNTDYLTSIILGNNPKKRKVIDFFDTISHDIISNDGEVFFLNPDLVGGCNYAGKRNTNYSFLNDLEDKYKIDYGSALCHFSSVGSGYHYEVNSGQINNIPSSYVLYAINRYNLYKYLALNDDKILNKKEFKYFRKFEKFKKYFLY